jgi:hypothetical protein
MNDKDAPVVIDAEYSLEEEKGGFFVSKKKGDVSLPGGFTLKDKDKQTLKKIITTVVKSGFYFLIWSVRQFGSLMVAGVSGTVDGIKGAADHDSRYDERDSRSDGRRRYQRRKDTPKKKDKPFWHIPTKEEEDAERRMRYEYE